MQKYFSFAPMLPVWCLVSCAGVHAEIVSQQVSCTLTAPGFVYNYSGSSDCDKSYSSGTTNGSVKTTTSVSPLGSSVDVIAMENDPSIFAGASESLDYRSYVNVSAGALRPGFIVIDGTALAGGTARLHIGSSVGYGLDATETSQTVDCPGVEAGGCEIPVTLGSPVTFEFLFEGLISPNPDAIGSLGNLSIGLEFLEADGKTTVPFVASETPLGSAVPEPSTAVNLALTIFCAGLILRQRRAMAEGTQVVKAQSNQQHATSTSG